MSLPLNALGMSEKKQTAFKNKGFKTGEDLIAYLPRRYDDLSKVVTIDQVQHKEFHAVIGMVLKAKEGNSNGRGYVSFTCKDQHEQLFWVTFFGPKNEAYRRCRVGQVYLFAGKWNVQQEPKKFVSLGNPTYVEADIQNAMKIVAVYKKVHKQISHDDFKRYLNVSLGSCEMMDYLEPELFHKWTCIDTEGFEFPLMLKSQAYRSVHHPQTLEQAVQAQYRLAFDELFKLSYILNSRSGKKPRGLAITLPKLDQSRQLIKNLPFKLTEGQFEVLRDMMQRVQSGNQLSALVQGDVGSGKTIVAIIMMICHAENNYQTMLLAPTTVLAKQHAQELEKLVTPFGYKVACLTGELKPKEKKEVMRQIEAGEVLFAVGTHALLSDKVKFKNLGLVIADEEQRFGVAQRESVQKKVDSECLNFINMTATPIPRTLACSLYDDNIQTYSIKTKPASRKPIETYHITDIEQMVDHLVHEIAQGRQAYLICPLIEENETMEKVMDIKRCQAWVESHPKLRHLRVGIATGKMKPEVMEANILAFKNKEYDLLISTTVIEVGVNVPNATIIGLLSADRFGLAQLHQLRGRVGRGEFQSYCYLVSDGYTEDGLKKLQAMCQSTDGFYLSEVDLKLRGAGDLVGESQTGFENTFMLLLKYPALFDKIQKEMAQIFLDEKRLKHYRSFFK